MQEYEIRILQEDGFPTLIMAQTQLSDEAAIRSARKMSHGRQFEVWRDMECITGRAKALWAIV